MSATRLALGLFLFQLPAVLVLFLGGGISVSLGYSPDWTIYFAVPLSVAMLLAGLVTWGLESFWALPDEARIRRVVRYQVPALIFIHLPILFYAWLGGALMKPRFHWNDALVVYGGLFGAYLFVGALPLVFIGLRGAVTPRR
jgi:hypothetical protein